MNKPLLFEELHEGDRWVSPSRTITDADVVNFAGMTGDFDPLHVDHEFASQSPFGRPIAHGLMGLAWVAGLSSTSPRTATHAFMGIVDWTFERPAYIGDTVHVITEVLAKEARSPRRGQVTWRRCLVNQNGDVIQSGNFITLVATAKGLRQRRDPAQQPAEPHAGTIAKAADSQASENTRSAGRGQ